MDRQEMMDAICKFKVGDLVVYKPLAEFAPPEAWIVDRVVERCVQQCYGGLLQVHYSVRGMAITPMRPTVRSALFGRQPDDKFTENELVALDTEKYRAAIADFNDGDWGLVAKSLNELTHPKEST